VTSGPHRAPPGFTPEQRERFDRHGYLLIEGAIGADDIARYLDAVERVLPAPDGGHKRFMAANNVVERDPVLAEVIDHPRHIGLMYDLFGEQLMLHQSEVFVRPGPSGPSNAWHPDGPRLVPYGVFTDRPLQVKVSYWLTDVPAAGMANLVIRPGSQHEEYFDRYDTWDSVDDELVLCPRAGDVVLVHNGVWHRVEPNETTETRKNLFFTYSPSWIVPGDRYQSDPDWLAGLTRERRILMRSYPHPYDHAKPPPDDVPLYLDRDTGLDHDPGRYADHVALYRRKRLLPDEKDPSATGR
jgi:ectoine hydroxylase-related dioxygenase (phytanoyl-CoA dioxygenase family)